MRAGERIPLIPRHTGKLGLDYQLNERIDLGGNGGRRELDVRNLALHLNRLRDFPHLEGEIQNLLSPYGQRNVGLYELGKPCS